MLKDVDEIKELLKKEEVIDSLKLTTKKKLKQKHCYLSGNSNLVEPTLITELNKKINLYGKIKISAIYESKTIKLINPNDDECRVGHHSMTSQVKQNTK